MRHRSARSMALAVAAAAALLGAGPPAPVPSQAVPPQPVPAARPAVTGVSHLAVFSRDMAASARFYTHVLGAREAAEPDDPGARRYWLSGRQYVEVLPAPAGLGASVLAHVGYTTANAAGLRAWLSAHGQPGVSGLHADPDGARWFSTRDPEGNEVRFVQPAASASAAPVSGAISGRIIHVGYAVHDRAGEDAFYRRLLGFRPYWFGAFDASKVDWVSQQVPDGHDWLEYMMVGPGSDVSADKVDAHELGVLNHLSLGVPNMEAAVTTLVREDRLSPRHDGPQMGLDGKWQANLYDPDGTRVELMEFKPVAKPCCSPFTAASPAG